MGDEVDDKDVQETLMVRQQRCGGRLNKGCWDHMR